MLLNTQNALPTDFTQGDNVVLSLIATDDFGNPVNLTGGTLSTMILGANGVGPVTFPNSQHTLGNQSTNPGTFTLTLAATDSANCGEGANKQIITTFTSSGGLITNFRGVNLLTVYPPNPAQ